MLRVGFAAVRVLVLVNPAASSVTAPARAALERTLRAALHVEVSETTRRGHATEIARRAAADGFDVVAVFAGDGTLNEAANGLAGTTTVLAPLPGGSTNVFARTLGVAFDPLDAAKQLVDSLATRSFRRVGLGAAAAPGQERRRFLFHLGLGFDAAVIRRMEQRSYLKRHFAHPAFALAAVDTWARHYDRRSAIRLESIGPDGIETATGPYAVISNSDPYTYVGHRRMSIAAGASLSRPLAVTVLRSLGAGLIVRATSSAVGSGAFMASAPDITQITDVTSVEVSGDRPFPWQVDGDYLGEIGRVEVLYEPDTLTLVVP
ncbi:MAG TPA: diacylglycerol kinase family protein [Acidimicrobiia bacterium]